MAVPIAPEIGGPARAPIDKMLINIPSRLPTSSVSPIKKLSPKRSDILPAAKCRRVVVGVVLVDKVIEVEEVSEEGAADVAVCTCGLFDFLILECLTDILQFSGPGGGGHGRGGASRGGRGGRGRSACAGWICGSCPPSHPLSRRSSNEPGGALVTLECTDVASVPGASSRGLMLANGVSWDRGRLLACSALPTGKSERDAVSGGVLEGTKGVVSC